MTFLIVAELQPGLLENRSAKTREPTASPVTRCSLITAASTACARASRILFSVALRVELRRGISSLLEKQSKLTRRRPLRSIKESFVALQTLELLCSFPRVT